LGALISTLNQLSLSITKPTNKTVGFCFIIIRRLNKLQQQQESRIELIIGPMFSGKTTEMLRRLTRYQIAGKKVVLLRPNKDTRDYLTHDKRSSNIKEKLLRYVCEFNTDYYDVIGIDEGQFFSDLNLINTLAYYKNKIIIISGLSSDANQNGYDSILSVIPLSETITKLNAVCEDCCSDYGSFTVKKDKSNTNEIGGKDLYKAVCRSCLNK
jgi:thymidine kinase